MIKDHRSKACVFRGHDESSYTKNQGNYIELIKLLATYNDKVPGVVLTNAPQNAKYTSSQIQNEILDIFATKCEMWFAKKLGMPSFAFLLMKLGMRKNGANGNHFEICW